MKLKSAAANPQTPVYYVVNQILYPLVQGCESKDLKIIKVKQETKIFLENSSSLQIFFSSSKVLPWHDATTDYTASC